MLTNDVVSFEQPDPDWVLRAYGGSALTFCIHNLGPGCSQLTTSFVNVLLKFQTYISKICQYFG